MCLLGGGGWEWAEQSSSPFGQIQLHIKEAAVPCQLPPPHRQVGSESVLGSATCDRDPREE